MAAPEDDYPGCGGCLLVLVGCLLAFYFWLAAVAWIDASSRAVSACPGVGVSRVQWHAPKPTAPFRMYAEVHCLDGKVVRVGRTVYDAK